MFLKNLALFLGVVYSFFSFVNIPSSDTTGVKYENPLNLSVQKKNKKVAKKSPNGTVLYGNASYYASKFHGRRTASGDTFDHKKMTAACNALPLGTWIRVTNLKNKKSVIVRTNDRLAKNTTRLVDLTMAATKKLGFGAAGLTRVKVEVVAKNTQ